MNFIFISPNFPHSYWNFCDRLKKRGVNVLGIGDASYESLLPELKDCLTEYFRVESLSSYEQVSLSVTEGSTGLSPTTNTGLSRMRFFARTSISRVGCKALRSSHSRARRQ